MKTNLRQRLGRAWMAGALGAALIGCGQRLTDANLEEVVPDMSRKEVESILGQPSRTKSHELTLQTQMKTLTATRYYYDQNGQKVELIFVADKLVGKNGYFDAGSALATRVAEKANSDQPIPGIDSDQLIMRQPPTVLSTEPPIAENDAPTVEEPPLPEAAETAVGDPAPRSDEEVNP